MQLVCVRVRARVVPTTNSPSARASSFVRFVHDGSSPLHARIMDSSLEPIPPQSQTRCLTSRARMQQRGLVEAIPPPYRSAAHLHPLIGQEEECRTMAPVVRGRQAGAWAGASTANGLVRSVRPLMRASVARDQLHAMRLMASPASSPRCDVTKASNAISLGDTQPYYSADAATESPFVPPPSLASGTSRRASLQQGEQQSESRNLVNRRGKALLDRDGDGRVTRREFVAAVDANGDGKVSWEEVERFEKRTSVASAVSSVACNGRRDPRLKRIFAQGLDECGDGVVTRAELHKVLKKLPPPSSSPIGCYAHLNASETWLPPPDHFLPALRARPAARSSVSASAAGGAVGFDVSAVSPRGGYERATTAPMACVRE